MPHLHLPVDHTDEDLILAANVADVVGSEDLYVAWSHRRGAGEVPEVEAVVREERAPATSLQDALVAACAGLLAIWHALMSRAPAEPPAGALPPAAPRRAGEPSA